MKLTSLNGKNELISLIFGKKNTHCFVFSDQTVKIQEYTSSFYLLILWKNWDGYVCFPEVKSNSNSSVDIEAEQLLGLFCLDLDMFSYRIKESQITFYRVKVSRRTNGKKDRVKHCWTKLYFKKFLNKINVCRYF